tara:strand:- start:365 stop:2470 length:2106 start_codon:yes stop_codon:yes gene_type:complete
MSLIAQKLISASGATEEIDDDFNLVTGLYHFDGSDGGTNSTFLDSSSNSRTVTEVTDVVQGTISPFSGPVGHWSVSPLVAGTSTAQVGYETESTTAMAFGTGDYTVEFFVFLNNLATVGSYTFSVVYDNNDATTRQLGYFYDVAQDGNIYFYPATGSTGTNGRVLLSNPFGRWIHIAQVRISNTQYVYVDGVQSASASDYLNYGTSAFNINLFHRYQALSGHFFSLEGKISNFRVVKGSGIYTSNFTVPTSPLTAISGTTFLAFQDGRYKDNSGNNITATYKAGNIYLPFSPFAPDSSYSPSVRGGSVGMGMSAFQTVDGYLEVASSSDFDYTSSLCVDGWFYMTSSPGDTSNAHAIVNRWAATSGDRGFLIDIESTGLRVLVNQGGSTNVTVCDPGSSGAIDLFSWHHFALTWDGTTYRAFLDGALEGSATGNAAPTGNGKVVRIGYNTNTHYFGGYISNVRIVVDGGAIYTSAFTPPTAPTTAISGTELLVNGTNGSIFDSSSKFSENVVGNTSLNTSVKKFGTASAKFDEVGDYIKLNYYDFVVFGQGDFTIECFVYFLATTSNGQGIFQLSNNYLNSQNGRGPALGTYDGTGKWYIYYGAGENQTNTIGNAVAAPSTNTWYHVAFVRTSGVIKFFVDGTQIGSNINYTGNYSDRYFTIGGWYSTSYLLNGYIDEFRISHKARYTSNFTTPTKAFPSR